MLIEPGRLEPSAIAAAEFLYIPSILVEKFQKVIDNKEISRKVTDRLSNCVELFLCIVKRYIRDNFGTKLFERIFFLRILGGANLFKKNLLYGF